LGERPIPATICCTSDNVAQNHYCDGTRARTRSNATWVKSSLDPWNVKVWEIRPIPQTRRIATDSNPLRITWCRAIKDEQLMPARRGDMAIWRCCDSAYITRASESREYGAHSHAVTMRAGYGCQERYSHSRCCTLVQCYGDGEGFSVAEVGA
jgi:hypothetical protein